MKPEQKLDTYLKLIKRLEGKINLIRNTLGTDTPVLDEPENPIEYTDSVTDIYSSDIETRLKALKDAEKASDFLLSEDEFVADLKKFNLNESYTKEYKDKIFQISDGKWAVNPQHDVRGQKRPEVFGLARLCSESEPDPIGYQFAKIDRTGSTIELVPQLQALEWLRTSPDDNNRLIDKMTIEKVAIKETLESRVIQYFDTEETGSLIGQENTVLRLLYDNGYAPEDIDLVRGGFKTKNIFHKREVDKLKRNIMKQKNKNEVYQDGLRQLVKLAKDIEKNRNNKESLTPNKVESVLFYVNRNE